MFLYPWLTLFISSATCPQSSRVWQRTIAWGKYDLTSVSLPLTLYLLEPIQDWVSSIFSISGIEYAKVFPSPFFAYAIIDKSNLAHRIGMALAWILEANLYSNPFRFFIRVSDRYCFPVALDFKSSQFLYLYCFVSNFSATSGSFTSSSGFYFTSSGFYFTSSS